jgi:hypothetical protein
MPRRAVCPIATASADIFLLGDNAFYQANIFALSKIAKPMPVDI